MSEAELELVGKFLRTSEGIRGACTGTGTGTASASRSSLVLSHFLSEEVACSHAPSRSSRVSI
jgi:hypothetical protein